MVDEREAVTALERLGLTGYEAKAFIALQKLGAGTARDVDRIADVPRSQVYGAAEGLEERGLVDVQHGNPIEYRPVSLEEARSQLTDQLERDRDAAIDYLESVEDERAAVREERQEIWTVRGPEAVGDRVAQLLGEADDRVVFGVRDEALVTEPIDRMLREHADGGIDVVVVSRSAAVRDRYADVSSVVTTEPIAHREFEQKTGRLVIVDDRTVLLSVVGDEGIPDANEETAFWSTGSGFATVLVQLIEYGLAQTLD